MQHASDNRGDAEPAPEQVILLVSDDADERAAIASVLAPVLPQHTLRPAADAIAFAEALADARPAAAVVAQRLAWADGIAVLNAIRRRHRLCVSCLLAEPGGDIRIDVRLALDVIAERTPGGLKQLADRLVRALERVRRAAGASDLAPAEAVLDELSLGVLLIDADARVLHANRYVECLAGFGWGGWPGEVPLDDLLQPPSPQSDWAQRLRALREPARWVVRARAAPDTELLLHVSPARYRGGSYVAALAVRPPEVAMTPAAAASAAPPSSPPAEDTRSDYLDELTYAVSHDLQAPLRVIHHYLRSVAARPDLAGDAQLNDALAQIRASADQMQALLDGIIAAARAGGSAPHRVPVDFNAALDEALAGLATQIEESGAEVHRAALPVLEADYDQVVLLFRNLIGNAIKFRGEEPPVISVGAVEHADSWLFAIKDNGIGIDPRFQDKIFGLFQRLHTGEEYPGTGLGLALCRRIVERHGGRIWVKSAPGQGTTVFFTWPKAGARPQGDAAPGA